MTYPILLALVNGLIWFLNLISWLIVVSAVLSFFLHPRHRVQVLLRRITEPFVLPFRLLLRRFMGRAPRMPLDLSPLLALIGLWVLMSILQRLSFYILRLMR